MKKMFLVLGATLALLVIGNGVYSYLNNSPKTERVPVSKFNDGKNGYSISIPTGNTSICTWNAVDGNSEIPYHKTTEARATDTHVVYTYDYSDWIVNCVDDSGNHYTGIFPKD